ncbi:MAG: AAA domain-containing protein [Pirellula sp.]
MSNAPQRSMPFDSTPLILDRHFAQLREWLNMESEAERKRLAERRRNRDSARAENGGDTLLDLVIEDHRSGIGGRFLVTFVKRNRTLNLPWNRFRVGSPIIVSDGEDEASSIYGIVCGRNVRSIEVALDDWPSGDRFRLDLSPDEVTRNRQLAALGAIGNARGSVALLREMLLNGREPRFDPLTSLPIDSRFNESQRQAIEFAMSARDLAIIHGPPGTGKTTTVVELIRHAVDQGMKVLACAPSNTGVDNLLEKLVANRIRVVRLGHPARVQEAMQAYTLDALVESDGATKIVAEMMREAEKLAVKAGKFTRSAPAPGARKDLRQESRQLREDAKLYERQIIASILDRADVVCATTNFDPEILGDRQFQMAVIDEACQSTEPGSWPVVLRAEKIVLAGDHCQLPPTIISAEAATQGFSISLMERLVRTYGDKITRQLTVQYRMHDEIMQYSSDCFYGGTLVSHESVRSHLLKDLVPPPHTAMIEGPVTFVDTAGAGWEEETDPDGESRCNPQEGKWILMQLRELCESGIPPDGIAVIAPYAAQVRWLRMQCPYRAIEIDTVDGFQGREKEAILISLVRSNRDSEIGFLADTRRMNVALTRARRKLILIGDSATLAAHEFYANMIAYIEKIGGYRTIWDWGVEN